MARNSHVDTNKAAQKDQQDTVEQISSITEQPTPPDKDGIKLNFDRRNALLAALGVAAGVPAARLADELYSKSKSKEKTYAFTASVDLQNAVDRQVTRGRYNNYKTIMSRYASLPAELSDKKSRLSYVIEKCRESGLPGMLKEILPYLPMQESNYKPCLKSSAGALGVWQFMRGTGMKYPSSSSPLVKPGSHDKRCDFKESTVAAIAYFEDIIIKLSKDESFAELQKHFKSTLDDFLSLAAVNAYNAGEGHITRAMKMIIKEPKLLAEANAAFSTGGGTALYVYLTQVYNAKSSMGKHNGSYGKKWQSGLKPKYGPHASQYVFSILAYKKIHEKRNGTFKQPESVAAVQTTTRRKLGSAGAALAGALTTGLIYLGVMRAKGQIPDKTNRREFMQNAGLIAAGGVIGGIAENNLHLTSPDLSCDLPHKTKESKKHLPLYAGKMQLYIEDIKRICGCADKSPEEILNPKSYTFTQALADKSFEEFNNTSDRKYAFIAKYYYEKCHHLIKLQLSGKYKMPARDGMAKVKQRKLYVDNALRVVKAILNGDS